jgi:hypothetical protein
MTTREKIVIAQVQIVVSIAAYPRSRKPSASLLRGPVYTFTLAVGAEFEEGALKPEMIKLPSPTVEVPTTASVAPVLTLIGVFEIVMAGLPGISVWVPTTKCVAESAVMVWPPIMRKGTVCDVEMAGPPGVKT